jgi:hypothetical protein
LKYFFSHSQTRWVFGEKFPNYITFQVVGSQRTHWNSSGTVTFSIVMLHLHTVIRCTVSNSEPTNSLSLCQSYSCMYVLYLNTYMYGYVRTDVRMVYTKTNERDHKLLMISTIVLATSLRNVKKISDKSTPHQKVRVKRTPA